MDVITSPIHAGIIVKTCSQKGTLHRITINAIIRIAKMKHKVFVRYSSELSEI